MSRDRRCPRCGEDRRICDCDMQSGGALMPPWVAEAARQLAERRADTATPRRLSEHARPWSPRD